MNGSFTPTINGDYYIFAIDECRRVLKSEKLNFIIDDKLEVNIQDLNIYPNPTDELIFVEFSALNSNSVIISIDNTLGQEVLRKEFNNYKKNFFGRIDVNHLSQGIYYVNLNSLIV